MQYPSINGDTASIFTNEINLSDGNSNQAKIYPNSAGLAIVSSPNNTLVANRVKLTGPIDESDSAASKLYVDSFVTTGIHWKKPVISFRDLDFDMPSSPTIGDRYIQLADSGFFVKDYVYEYNGSVFVQHVTIEGDCLYVLGGTKFPDKTIVYSIIDGTGEWVQTGSSFDQTLNRADSVQFAGLVTTGQATLHSLKMNGTAPIISGIKNAVIASSVNHDNLLTEQAAVRYGDNSGRILGFVNNNESIISISGSTFTIEPASGYTSFSYYCEDPADGIIKMYTKTTAETVSVTLGGLVFYYGSSLQVSNTFSSEIIKQYALVAYVNRYGSINTIFSDERHTIAMHASTHYNLHNTVGSRLLRGGTINLTLNDTSQTGVTIEQGAILDEDLEHILSTKEPGDNMRVLRFIGTDESSIGITYSEANGPYTLSGTTLQRNAFIGGSWELAPVSNNNYVLGHILATNALILDNSSTGYVRYMGLLGQNQYNTVNSARDGALNEIKNMYLVGLPLPEFVFIGTVIYQQDGTSIKLVAVDSSGSKYIDWRDKSINGIGVTPSSHSALSGLLNDDHPQYALVTGRADQQLTTHSIKLAGTSPIISSINTTLGTLDTSIPTCKAVRTAIANQTSVSISSESDAALIVAGGVNMGTRDLTKTAWELIYLETLGTLSKIVYGRGRFVIIPSDNTYVMVSPGRGPWTTYPGAIVAGARTSLVYEGGIFLASRSGAIDYSITGTEWFPCLGLSANNWQSIAYHNGIWSAVSSNGTNRAAYSTDGIRWTMNDSLANTIAHRVIHYSPIINKFIAVGDNRYICQSDDGIKWAAGAQLLPVNEVFSQVLSTDQFIVFVGDSNCYYTVDLFTITLSPLSAHIVNPIRHISFHEDVYIASNQDGHFKSIDIFDFVPMAGGNVLMTAYANGDWLSIDLDGSIRRWTPYNVHNTVGINQSGFIRGDTFSTIATTDRLIAAKANITDITGNTSDLRMTSRAGAFQPKLMKILSGTSTVLTKNDPQKIWMNVSTHDLTMPLGDVTMEGSEWTVMLNQFAGSVTIKIQNGTASKTLVIGSADVVLYASQHVIIELIDAAYDSGYGLWLVRYKNNYPTQYQLITKSESLTTSITSSSFVIISATLKISVPPGKWLIWFKTPAYMVNCGGNIGIAQLVPPSSFTVISETLSAAYCSGELTALMDGKHIINVTTTTEYTLVANRATASTFRLDNVLGTNVTTITAMRLQ